MSKSQLIEPKKLKGFRDYGPQLMAARESLLEIIRKTAALSGFDAISTPALEYATVLLGSGGDETDKQVYRFNDSGDREVAMRFDLTVPFARYVAEHQSELSLPFKKLQIGNVWRGENPQKGRYREFMQCDLDIVGANTLEADLEILCCLHKILNAMNFGSFTVAIGNRVLLSGLIQSLLPQSQSETKVLIALDKLEKIGRDKVLALLCEIDGVESDGAEKLLDVLISKDANGDTDLQQVGDSLADDPALKDELSRYQQTIRCLKARFQSSLGKAQADLSIARGLGYYTGLVFECTIDDLPKFGSICSGGRYDGLVARFSRRSFAGIGGSIGIDRLLAGLEELNKMPEANPPSLLVVAISEDTREFAYRIAEKMRDQGVATELGLQTKIGQVYKYADKRSIRWVAAVGPDEMQANCCSLKDLNSGEEKRQLPIDKLSDSIQT